MKKGCVIIMSALTAVWGLILTIHYTHGYAIRILVISTS